MCLESCNGMDIILKSCTDNKNEQTESTFLPTHPSISRNDKTRRSVGVKNKEVVVMVDEVLTNSYSR